jgi:hypothetical protein
MCARGIRSCHAGTGVIATALIFYGLLVFIVNAVGEDHLHVTLADRLVWWPLEAMLMSIGFVLSNPALIAASVMVVASVACLLFVYAVAYAPWLLAWVF